MGRGGGRSGGRVGEEGGRVGWEMVKDGLKEDDLLQVLGFLMMGIFRSVSNFQVGLHFIGIVRLEKGKCLKTSSSLSSFLLDEWDFCSGELLVLVCCFEHSLFFRKRWFI